MKRRAFPATGLDTLIVPNLTRAQEGFCHLILGDDESLADAIMNAPEGFSDFTEDAVHTAWKVYYWYPPPDGHIFRAPGNRGSPGMCCGVGGRQKRRT